MHISAIVAHIALPFTNGVTTNEHGVGPEACEGAIAGFRLALAGQSLLIGLQPIATLFASGVRLSPCLPELEELHDSQLLRRNTLHTPNRLRVTHCTAG